jgi:hypothetical protein
MNRNLEKKAFVPGYANDLFISYAHIDNRSQWVEKLHKRLEEQLAEFLGEDVCIWRDPSLNEGVDILSDTLSAQVSQSALFLSVLSPRYISSDSCRKEADWFLECIKKSGKPTVGNMSRMIRVVKTPFDSAEPVSLQKFETLGLDFYERKEDGIPRTYAADKDVDPVGYQRFCERAERLAWSIVQLLSKLRETIPAPAVATGKTVYLAYVTQDKAQERQKLTNAFTAKGFSVVPEEPPADTIEELEAILNRSVPSCNMAVHAMGRRYGLVPEGDAEQRSIVRLQYEWIRKNTGVRQLVWVPEELTEVEERQAAFLTSIRNTGDQRCEFFTTTFQPFCDGVLDELAKREPKRRIDRAKSIFLLFDHTDLDKSLRKAIRSYLLEQGYPVFEPAFQGDGSLIRRLEAENIRTNSATLIYYGTATDAWVQMKRQTLRKVLAGTESGGKHVRAIYLCDPEDEVKRNTYLEFSGKELPEGGGFTPLLIVGDCKEQFVPEKLAPFLKHLEEDIAC